jgi:putative copper export protein
MPLADFVVIGLRGLAFAAALQAAGGPIFLQLFSRHLDQAFRSVRSVAVWSAGVALLFVSLHALVEPARLTGDLSGMFDTSLHKVLLASDAGTTLAIRVMGLLLILIGLAGVRRGSSTLALAGATLVVASFAFMGHTVTDDQRWLVAPLLIIHLLVVAFWFGGLWPLLCVIRHESMAVEL